MAAELTSYNTRKFHSLHSANSGEWCNSVPETTVTAQYRITVRNRQNTKLGNGINILGSIVIAVGIYFG